MVGSSANGRQHKEGGERRRPTGRIGEEKDGAMMIRGRGELRPCRLNQGIGIVNRRRWLGVEGSGGGVFLLICFSLSLSPLVAAEVEKYPEGSSIWSGG